MELVARVGQIAREVPELDSTVVSTDDPEIRDVAVASGLDFHGFRPEDLSGDRVPDAPVLIHELLQAEEADGVQYDIIVMLQPTTPLRRPEHVSESIRMCVDDGLDAVWTVSVTDPEYHPKKALDMSDDGIVTFHHADGVKVVARQELTPIYHRNGASYAITRESLLTTSDTMGRRTAGVLIDEPMLSIDTAEDLEMCEYYLEKRKG